MPNRSRKAPVVAVLNMKGGVGKTTIAGNLFREMFRIKDINILLIDLDAQFNLTQLLLTRVQYDELLSEEKTIYTVFQHQVPDSVFAVSEDYHLELPSADQITYPLESIRDKELLLLPGDSRKKRNIWGRRLWSGGCENGREDGDYIGPGSGSTHPSNTESMTRRAKRSQSP